MKDMVSKTEYKRADDRFQKPAKRYNNFIKSTTGKDVAWEVTTITDPGEVDRFGFSLGPAVDKPEFLSMLYTSEDEAYKDLEMNVTGFLDRELQKEKEKEKEDNTNSKDILAKVRAPEEKKEEEEEKERKERKEREKKKKDRMGRGWRAISGFATRSRT